MLLFSLIFLQILFLIGLILVFRRILSRNVVQATMHLDELNEDYSKKEQEAGRRLEEAKKTSEELVAKAREEADKKREQIINEADAEKEKILREARSQGEEIMKQADRSRQRLISELEERISKGAIDKACELIQDTLPEQFKRDVHSQWTEDLIKGGLDQLRHLQIPEDINEAKITSAFPLNDAQRKNLSKQLNQLLGKDIKLKEEGDPKLVAGVVVTMGNLVLDGSLKNRIQEQAGRGTGSGERRNENGE